MTIKNIHIELARTPDQPNGDAGHAYEFRAPLDKDGFLDRTAWRSAKPLCTVRRYMEGLEVEQGLLILSRGGHWAFSYAPGREDDEDVFKLGNHRIVPGEYLTITEHDGATRTFRVTSVRDWHAGAEGRAAH